MNSFNAFRVYSNQTFLQTYIKPSEYEKDEFLTLCQKGKLMLLKTIEELRNKDKTIPICDNLIGDIKSLEVHKLYDCKILGDYFFNIGNIVRRHYNISGFMMPLGIDTLMRYISVIEMLIFVLGSTIVLNIIF